MLLLFLSSLFLYENWDDSEKEKETAHLALGNDHSVEIKISHRQLITLSFIFLMLMIFEGRAGPADWFLSIFFGLPTFPKDPVLRLSKRDLILLDVTAREIFFLGTVVVVYSKPFWKLALIFLFQYDYKSRFQL